MSKKAERINTEPMKVILKKAAGNPVQTTIDLYHSSTSILNDSINTIGNLIERFRVRAELNSGLDEKEVKSFNELVRTIILIEKHTVEMTKSNELNKKLATMSDAELLEYAKTITSSTDKTYETVKKSADAATKTIEKATPEETK